MATLLIVTGSAFWLTLAYLGADKIRRYGVPRRKRLPYCREIISSVRAVLNHLN